jgi:hypothetical protein
MQIARESAWSKSDTRTSELVLISAARFTTEQRVKAWAMCHYLVHWQPELIVELDQSKTEEIKTPPDVEAEFLRRTGIELPKIDHDWREFWGRADELRLAMKKDPIPSKDAKERKAVERSRSLVDAVNAQRAAARVGPLGWFLVGGGDLVLVRRYEKALQKAEKEQARRDAKAKAGEKVPPVVMPEPPAAIGRTIFWSRLESADQAVALWLGSPVARNTLLHPGRMLLGAPTDEGGWAIDVNTEAQPTTKGLPMVWPREKQSGVPKSARVRDLGARAAAAVMAAGKTEDDVVGMPLSLHFLRAIDARLLAAIRCDVYAGDLPVNGVIVVYQDGGGDGDGVAAGDAADGLVAFVPLEPLPVNHWVGVRWQLPREFLAEDQTFPEIQFTAR